MSTSSRRDELRVFVYPATGKTLLDSIKKVQLTIRSSSKAEGSFIHPATSCINTAAEQSDPEVPLVVFGSPV
ncbi:hypothetical protein PHYPO_G00074930 [Pangasianodon hypophthalmus]|uniref:Uncharacterized protein n=1 Tax=Pangasianodon hypophthalmus TaxID=310915 RepID=A0A5N5LVE7_PANHP|nr:hypothetical protein PHYPO_G00074930 [Pangasianodon hypophthalmus]